MSEITLFAHHNRLTINVKKIYPRYAKLINDTMYELTQIDGAYKYDCTGDCTVLTIYPEDYDFGDDPIEHQKALDIYKQCYQSVIDNYPECLC